MTKGPRELFPWIVPFEKHLTEKGKVLIVPIHRWDNEQDKPAHANSGGFVEIVFQESSEEIEGREIDLMTAISRGLVTYDKENEEVVWGGIVRYSISIHKL
jgi:hypothetical protein